MRKFKTRIIMLFGAVCLLSLAGCNPTSSRNSSCCCTQNSCGMSKQKTKSGPFARRSRNSPSNCCSGCCSNNIQECCCFTQSCRACMYCGPCGKNNYKGNKHNCARSYQYNKKGKGKSKKRPKR